LNHRPLGYEPNELPDCSTPQNDDNNRSAERQRGTLPFRSVVCSKMTIDSKSEKQTRDP